ncbi:hypothetical protein OKA05_20995 [Luteolibacter arcticus]|uniref:Uncharacterized protein n=1 Tax=Luteolibacter arcticus TaxID=1581411 RepID=A0ABT3GNE7_9BACT|nr:hypothetical protein [Luteolibacter arcticus]MCW1925051.1 hypothetical protein [Luteolibacter arcticus]
MKAIPLLRLLVAAAVVSCGALHAQDSASIRLLAFSRVGDALEVMVAGADGKLLNDKPLALPTEQLSPAVTVGTRSLVFQTPGATPAPLGKVDLPATGKDFILIFLPDAKAATPSYKVDPVPVPEGGFGSGDHAFVNYSGSNVGFVIGGEKLQVPQGKSATYHPKETGGNRTMAGYHQGKDGKWSTTPFYSSRLIIQEGVRNLVLIVRDPKTGLPDFRGISDFVEKPAATP